ncbi:hypothetical protein AB1Y20_001310 [Prymnesium parvum]|uniref:KIF-binding protein n=1 Tax=Prymnesium parvum TaxID=97485 RepID=A0AB34K8A8_PRYPA
MDASTAPEALLPPRPEQRLSALEATIAEGEREGTNAAQIVQWRQQCLALVHLAFRSDLFQVARASAKLASAYLAMGYAEAALGHARQAETLLQGLPPSHSGSSLLPEVLHCLAMSLAQSHEPTKATACFKRALHACEKVYGAGHVEACTILKSWTEMALRGKHKDYALAHRLLQQQIDIRNSQRARTPLSDEAARTAERHEILSLVQERARLMLAHARTLEEKAAADATPGGTAPVNPKVRQLRQRAMALLQAELRHVDAPSATDDGTTNDGDAVDLSEPEAKLALRLAEVSRELGEWEQAEQALVHAVSYFEDSNGMSDQKTISLWLEIATVRMKLHKYEAAAVDLQHCFAMQQVLFQENEAALIPTLEKLCKAHVLLRQWQPALEALNKAHTISTSQHGASHAETRRIADVIHYLEKHAQEA